MSENNSIFNLWRTYQIVFIYIIIKNSLNFFICQGGGCLRFTKDLIGKCRELSRSSLPVRSGIISYILC